MKRAILVLLLAAAGCGRTDCEPRTVSCTCWASPGLESCSGEPVPITVVGGCDRREDLAAASDACRSLLASPSYCYACD